MGHEDNKSLVQKAREANQKRSEAHSKTTLKRHLEKKFKTTMIGALSKFENIFGHLWGHGLPEDQLTPEQREMAEAWQLARTEVLNNGNNQLRAALSEVDCYTVNYQKKQYEFKLVQKDDQE